MKKRLDSILMMWTLSNRAALKRAAEKVVP